MLYIEEHELNLKGLFKRLDRDNDEFISLKEFKLSLKELFRVTAKDEEVEAVFEKFDTARSFRLNQEEFELAIFGEAPTE
jgi:Ca2+-binding EF-hand superfamily protein